MDVLIGQFQLSFGHLFDEEIPRSEHLSASYCEGKGVKREESGMGGAESNLHQGSAHVFNGLHCHLQMGFVRIKVRWV